MTTRKTNQQSKVLVPGYVVALALKEGTAPLRCYVGEVQAVDEHGIRLTLMDWFVGGFVSWDFFAPWDNVASAMIATPHHDVKSFGDAASDFQTQCNHMTEGKEAMERALEELRRSRAGARK